MTPGDQERQDAMADELFAKAASQVPTDNSPSAQKLATLINAVEALAADIEASTDSPAMRTVCGRLRSIAAEARR